MRQGYKKYLKSFVVVLVTAGALGTLLLATSGPADATETYMLRLPTYTVNACRNCHTSSSPVPSSFELNPFGEDFKLFDYAWSDSLAHRNSDGDKCTNGFELGDEDGDGIPDDPLAGGEENGNPGDSGDCPVAISGKTWGLIKKIFRNDD